MTTLTIAWQYLTGYAVATDPSTRDRPEWPPHPARVFMALAAAWFETEPPEPDDPDRDKWKAEGAALRWLETLGEPDIIAPPHNVAFERSNVTYYVPVNDKAGPSSASLQSCPELTRSKQPRSFPRTWVGNETCSLHWSNVADSLPHREALDRLCRKVTRLGHSSSLVNMWLTDETNGMSAQGVHFEPDEFGTSARARSVSPGMLGMLADRYGEQPRRHRAALTERIEALQAAKKSIKGNGGKERKALIDQEITPLKADLEATVTRPPVRPTIGLHTAYRQVVHTIVAGAPIHGMFDHDIQVLSQVKQGAAHSLVSTLVLTKALRGALMAKCVQPPPGWLSGHTPDGQPSRDGNGHLAIVPLPFVGPDYADGHLLGVGLVFPASIERKERGRVLGNVLINATSMESEIIDLKLGKLGEWQLRKPDWSELRLALQPAQWTAFPNGAKIWASVTPVVLDRFPKSERHDPKQRQDWEQEVRRIINDSCVRTNLPEPSLIDIDTTSWHVGSPRAVIKRRPLRGEGGSSVGNDAALGDGFPPYPAKGVNAPRPQVHIWMRFAEPVVGPVLLGAGRFLGYGLCKPIKENRS